MESAFEKFGLRSELLQAVKEIGFEQPTPIQQQAIPVLLEGRDLMGQAQTGTGKTAAFALPMLQMIEPGLGKVQALVLAPTRELAIQVANAASRMASQAAWNIVPVYGGQSYEIQIRQLKRGVDAVVGTPGRLLDLIRKNLLDLSAVRYLVIDEADEMLEMGFIEDVETIMAQMPQERQMALFSATLPDAIRSLAARYLQNPSEVRINPNRMTVAETEQRYCLVREEDKLPALTRFLEMEEVQNALVFARTKARAQDLADELARQGYPAASLHGDLNQARREYVLNRFRNHSITLLVATDVAARGLDIEGVSHVFNYDKPGDAEDYVHRIGRTGRAGRKGIAITFLTSRERRSLKEIEAYTRQAMVETAIPSREAILARRDERFINLLTEQLGKGSISRERSLIAKLEETSFDLAEIAAAAIRLARVNENNRPVEEITPPVVRTREERRNEWRSEGRQPAAERGIRADRNERGVGKSKNGASSKNRPNRFDPETAFPRGKGKGRQEHGMVRLWMNMGNSHGLRPGDVVGAIASETGIPGRAIGEIEIRSNYTLLDISEQHVKQVLKESGGYFLRGKPVMLKIADY